MTTQNIISPGTVPIPPDHPQYGRLVASSGQTYQPPNPHKLTYRQIVESVQFMGGGQIRGLRPGDWKKSAPRVEWLIHGILPKPAITLLYSAPKIGKSTLLGSWLKAMADGTDWAGCAAKQATVLYLSEESASSHSEIVEEVGLPDDAPIYFYGLHSKPDDWDRETFLVQIGEAVLAHNADLLIIDTMGSWLNLEDVNSYGEMVSLMRVCRFLADEFGIAIIVVHHTRKQAAGSSLDSALGSVGTIAGVDHPIQLTRKLGESKVTLTFNSRFRGSRKSMAVDYSDGVYIETNTTEINIPAPAKTPTPQLHLIQLFDGKEGIPFRHSEIVALAESLNPPLNKGHIKRALDWGKEKGNCITQDEEGRYTYAPVRVPLLV